MKNKRIIFMGTPSIAAEYLIELIEKNYNIIAVFTQPPRKKDRGMKIQFSEVHKVSQKNNIPTFTPTVFNEKDELENFKNLKPDLAIVIAYGIILPNIYLEIPKFGFINIHFSLLPKWRGASPIEHSLLNGDKETGVTIFRLNSELDAGPIISFKSIKIEEKIQKRELFTELKNLGKDLLINTLPEYFDNNLETISQDSKNLSYAKKITTEDRKIDFYSDVKKINNKIRAFSPKPGAWFLLGGERIKIIECNYGFKKSIPSTIINEKFHLGCKDGHIEPIIIQKEGKKAMLISNFIKGFRFNIGQKIND